MKSPEEGSPAAAPALPAPAAHDSFTFAAFGEESAAAADTLGGGAALPPPPPASPEKEEPPPPASPEKEERRTASVSLTPGSPPQGGASPYGSFNAGSPPWAADAEAEAGGEPQSAAALEAAAAAARAEAADAARAALVAAERAGLPTRPPPSPLPAMAAAHANYAVCSERGGRLWQGEGASDAALPW